jgi:hypothetical protein
VIGGKWLRLVTTVAWHGYCVANCRNRRAHPRGCQRLVCAPEYAFSRTLRRGRRPLCDSCGETLAIETGRRHDQRRPHLTGAEKSPDSGHSYQLIVTLDSDDPPLSALDVTIRPGQGVTFQRNFSGVVPTGGSEADCLRAFAYNQTNQPAGLRPGESISWWATVAQKHPSTIKVDAECQAPDDEAWTVVLEAKVQPRIENTIALPD